MSHSVDTSGYPYHTVRRKPVPSQISYSVVEDVTLSNAEQRCPVDLQSPRMQSTIPCDKQSWFTVWWLEISCCILSIATFMGIVGILVPYRRHEQPLQQLPYHISINTVLAILTSALKTCSLVALTEGLSQLKWDQFRKATPLWHLITSDTASRGPWGCLRLLMELRWHHYLASFGALITVLLVAIDPFTQQLVKYSYCAVSATNGSVATIPRTSGYWANDNVHVEDPFKLQLSQMNSILAGLFTLGETKIPVQCASGNCTFSDTYATLSFCSHCDDATNELAYGIENSTTGGPWDYARLPSGLSVSAMRYSSAIFNMAPTGEMNYFDMVPHNSLQTTVELVFVNPFFPDDWFATFWQGSCSSAIEKTTWGCQPRGAARCTIQPCVQVLQGSVRSGALNEKVVEVFTDWYHGMDDTQVYGYSAMADMDCVNASTKAQLKALGHDVTNTTRFIPYDVINFSTGDYRQITNNFTLPSFNMTSEQRSLIPAQCIYQISDQTTAALQNFFLNAFTQQVNISMSSSVLNGEISGLTILNDTYTNAGLIQDLFQSMTNSLSVLVRQSVYTNYNFTTNTFYPMSVFNTPATGTVLVGETCVSVRWPWLAYPAALTTLTIAFLILVIGRTEFQETDALARGWKSSVLPLVYGHVYRMATEKSSLVMHQRGDIKSMERAAKQDDVGLVHAI